MDKTLVIVESPGKIKKIKSILGEKYDIEASYGHIIDLDDKNMSIDINNNFEPIYKIIPRQEKVVNKLKQISKKYNTILLAADEDREGEMIAWSLAYILKIKNPKRIIFNSITKTELLNAINNPKEIDQDYVNAQKTRRILDKLIGYELSPVLWNNIKYKLSAGRVLSVVVKIIVDKEESINTFMMTDIGSYFKFNGILTIKKNNNNLNCILFEKKNKNKNSEENILEEEIDNDSNNDEYKIKNKIKNVELSKKIMKKIINSDFKIYEITKNSSIKNPPAPFTTSTLQQEAGRKIGYSVKKTMSIAQNLYEAGHITYMRTDSVNISNDEIINIKKAILKNYGEEYYQFRVFNKKLKNTQEAHEAVRPTNIECENIQEENKIGHDELKLYNLIWKRTIASQMIAAKYNIIKIYIDISLLNKGSLLYHFINESSILIFDGFLIVYNIANSYEGTEDKTIKVGDILLPITITSEQEYYKPPSRYNEISLVNKMDPKNLGIGRPSTYAAIISKIQDKNYIIKSDIDGVEKDSIILKWEHNQENYNIDTKQIIIGKEKNKFVPTDLGKTVTLFLNDNFSEIMNYNFTAEMESKLDKIAENKLIWNDVIRTFYDKYHPIVLNLMNVQKNKDVNIMGTYPETGESICITVAKDKPVIKLIKQKEKCIYVDIVEPYTIDTITLENAISLLKQKMEFPKTLGKYLKQNIILHKSLTGYYISYGKNTFYKTETEINLDDAISLINDKRKNIINEFKSDKKIYTILNGQYGPYISVNNGTKKNNTFKIPSTIILEDINLEKVKEIIDNSKKKFKK
jgi:DNA topoisomerase-1